MTPADKPDLPLKRSVETWSKCDPAAMAAQSEAAIYFAFRDLLSDVQTLARALADERRTQEAALKTITQAIETLARADERRKALEEAKVAVSDTVCSCCCSEEEQAVADACVEAVQGLLDRKEPT